MTVDFAEIGDHLRAIRKERGETVQDIAERTGMIGHRLRAIEAGTKQPTLGDLHTLAKAYGCYLEIGIGAASLIRPSWVSP